MMDSGEGHNQRLTQRTQTTWLVLFLLLLLVLPLARFTIHALLVLLDTEDADQKAPSKFFVSLHKTVMSLQRGRDNTATTNRRHRLDLWTNLRDTTHPNPCTLARVP